MNPDYQKAIRATDPPSLPRVAVVCREKRETEIIFPKSRSFDILFASAKPPFILGCSSSSLVHSFVLTGYEYLMAVEVHGSSIDWRLYVINLVGLVQTVRLIFHGVGDQAIEKW